MFKTLLDKIKSWGKSFWDKSWTKLWGWVQMVPAGILTFISTVNSYITDPSVKSYLDMVDVPKWLTLGIALFGLITYLAHGRDDK
jgi:hypothetical protein